MHRRYRIGIEAAQNSRGSKKLELESRMAKVLSAREKSAPALLFSRRTNMEAAYVQDVLDACDTLVKSVRKVSDLPLGSEKVTLIRDTVSTLGDSLSFPHPENDFPPEGKEDVAERLMENIVRYMKQKAETVDQSHKRARAHNERIGPNYWNKSSYQYGESATFDDFSEILCSIGLVVPEANQEEIAGCVESTYHVFEELQTMTDSFVGSERFSYIGEMIEMMCRHEARMATVDLVSKIVSFL